MTGPVPPVGPLRMNAGDVTPATAGLLRWSPDSGWAAVRAPAMVARFRAGCRPCTGRRLRSFDAPKEMIEPRWPPSRRTSWESWSSMCARHWIHLAATREGWVGMMNVRSGLPAQSLLRYWGR